MNIQEALCVTSALFEKIGTNTARLDARILLEHALGKDHTFIVLNPTYSLSKSEITTFNAYVARRLTHEPIAKIKGQKEFWSLSFLTSEHTLDPRPDSETLIEACLNFFHNKASPAHILDIGTGTGCLLMTLLSEFKSAHGVGLDLSPEALNIARQNADNLGFHERVTLYESNWLSALTSQSERQTPQKTQKTSHAKKFDIIISNPPYIPESERPSLAPDLCFDPIMALSYEDKADKYTQDGLSAYRHIAAQAHHVLAPNGIISIEYGQNQHEAVHTIFAHNGFDLISYHKDLSGIIRCSLFQIKGM